MTIEDRSYQSLAVCVAATIATTLAVGLRFISRRTAKAPYGWDDALIVLALVCLRRFEEYSAHKLIMLKDRQLWYDRWYFSGLQIWAWETHSGRPIRGTI